MGSVQPFLEGSFRRDRARGFGSIQSEAVTRVGRIRSLEEVRNFLDDRPPSNNFPVGRNQVLSRKDLPGYEGVQRSRRASAEEGETRKKTGERARKRTQQRLDAVFEPEIGPHVQPRPCFQK